MSHIYWISGTLLEIGVLVLSVWRGIFRRLPLFGTYLALVVANELIASAFLSFFGLTSTAYFYFYWLAQALLITARGLAVYDVCRWPLRSYPGVWRFAKPFLIAVGVILIAGSVLAARASASRAESTILTAERGLEIAVIGILMLGLAFCRYYGIRTERYIGIIGLGLGFYSLAQIVNNTFLQQWLTSYFPVWKSLRHLSFSGATVCWLVALWKPLPAKQHVPILLTADEYKAFAPEVSLRLRQLNARLLEMWK